VFRAALSLPGETEIAGHTDQGLSNDRADPLAAKPERCSHSDRQIPELCSPGAAEDREVDEILGAQHPRVAGICGMAVLDVELPSRPARTRISHSAIAGRQNERSSRLPAAGEEADELARAQKGIPDRGGSRTWLGVRSEMRVAPSRRIVRATS